MSNIIGCPSYCFSCNVLGYCPYSHNQEDNEDNEDNEINNSLIDLLLEKEFLDLFMK